MTSILNDIESVRAADPGNMYNAIFDLPEQLLEGIKIGNRWSVEIELFEGVKNIVAAGMGGSAIGAELVRSLLYSRIQVPFDICRHYILPEFVDDETLFIASSYSGNTEETLAATEDALGRKAMIAAVTTGGLLGDICKMNDIPMATLPEGLQPRSAVGLSFVAILMFLQKIGLVRDAERDIKAAAEGLMKYREAYIEDNPVDSNPAKNLAEKIHGKLPLIYAGPTGTNAVALRFKHQLSENAKTLAYANWFSELNHNELVGWSKMIEEYKDRLVVLYLRDAEDHPLIRTRMNLVKDIIRETGVEVIDIHSRGDSTMERIFSLVQSTDFTTYYLAILNEVDPTPIEIIDQLKDALEHHRQGQ